MKGGEKTLEDGVKNKRFTVTIVAIALFVVLSFGTVHFVKSGVKDLEVQNRRYLQEVALKNKEILVSKVNSNLNALEGLANIVGSVKQLDTTHIMNILSLEKARVNFKRLGFVDINGTTMTTDGQSLEVTERTYYKKALHGVKNISPKLVDKVDGKFINVYAVPVYSQGTIQGVIFATAEISEFSELINMTSFSGNGFSYIIEKDGTLVAYTDNENAYAEMSNLFEDVDKTETSKKEIQKMKDTIAQGKNGVIEYDLNQKSRIAAYSNVGINDWYVVSVVPKEEVYQYADKIIRRNIMVCAIVEATFCILLFFLFITNRKNRKNLEVLAYMDEVTKGSNFNKFKIDATRLLRTCKDKKYMLIKLDVDKFKLINESYGFKMGNKILVMLWESIRNTIDPNLDIVARIISDEFIVLLHYDQEDEVEKKSAIFLETFEAKVKELLAYKFVFFEGRYKVERGEQDFKIMFEKVNFAHRFAKSSGQIVCDYDMEIKAKVINEKEIENHMEEALVDEEFQVYLQPKYELTFESIAGAEALVRWGRKDGKMIYPNTFIPIFEKNEFVIKLDLYMFRKTCQILESWIEEGIKPITISVNFSRLHLKNKDFVRSLIEIADEYHIPHHLLEIELTETIIYNNLEILEQVLEELHKAGFTLSMDDFGTGYSSLGLLKDIPVDVIKIDKSFFDECKDSTRGKTVIAHIMGMAKNLNIFTVAEGVETKENVDLLREVGCDTVQGYYYAKPMPAEQFKESLKREREKQKELF